MKELRDLLLEGKNHVELFFSTRLGRAIKIRPLTTWESDRVILDSLRGIKNRKVVDLLINISLGTIGLADRVDLSTDDYADFLEYKRRIDYHTCYHAMKDFEDITVEDLMDSTLEIHEIADRVRSMSVADPLTIDEFIQTEDGKVLASLHYILHVPLVNEAWKATPIQLLFLNGAYKAMMGPEEVSGITREYSTRDLQENPAMVLRRFFSEHERASRKDPAGH